MPAVRVPRETADLIETTVVSFPGGEQRAMLHRESLQNPTESERNSPFFGSIFGGGLCGWIVAARIGVTTSGRNRSRHKIKNIVIVHPSESHRL